MPNKFAQTLYKINLFRNFIFRPLTLGVRAIILNSDEQVLLVKHSYLRGWYLPGGKVDKGETLQEAIKRELKEELALTDVMIKDIHWAYSSMREYKNDHIVLFACETSVKPKVSCREIEAVQFFSPNDLPDDMSASTKQRLREFFEGLEKPSKW